MTLDCLGVTGFRFAPRQRFCSFSSRSSVPQPYSPIRLPTLLCIVRNCRQILIHRLPGGWVASYHQYRLEDSDEVTYLSIESRPVIRDAMAGPAINPLRWFG